MGGTYEEQKKDLVNEEFIFFMVQKCTSKVPCQKEKCANLGNWYL